MRVVVGLLRLLRRGRSSSIGSTSYPGLWFGSLVGCVWVAAKQLLGGVSMACVATSLCVAIGDQPPIAGWGRGTMLVPALGWVRVVCLVGCWMVVLM